MNDGKLADNRSRYWLERLEREDPDAAACLAAEVLGRQASTIGPRVWHLSDEDGEKPPLRVEVYKGEVAARRKAQMEAVARHKAAEAKRAQVLSRLWIPEREN